MPRSIWAGAKALRRVMRRWLRRFGPCSRKSPPARWRAKRAASCPSPKSTPCGPPALAPSRGRGRRRHQRAGTVDLLIKQAAADSNLAQALRGHVGFVEEIVNRPDGPRRKHWSERLARGELIGNAWTEIGDAKQAGFSTHIAEKNGQFTVNGQKFYTIGLLFADWIDLGVAGPGGENGAVQVWRDDPGVTIIDDWDGFGQIPTASGTALFKDAAVDPADFRPDDQQFRYGAAFYQIVHLTTLAGIGRALAHETAQIVMISSISTV